MKRRFSKIMTASFVILMLLIAGIGIWNYSMKNRNNNQPDQKSNTYSKLGYIDGSGSSAYRFPAEFEKQEAIWMQWPSEVYDQGARPVSPVMIKIMKAFAPYIRVNVMARDANEIIRIKSLLKSSGYTGSSIHFYIIDHLSIWARDVGPIFVRDGSNKLRVVDFGFNNYSRGGNKVYIDTENKVDRLVAAKFGLPVVGTSLISEGGAIESNGKGILMLTESVILKRNPGMTKQQIENEYRRVLGIRKFIWLKKGLAEDDAITSGHINEFARFASPNIVLLAKIMPIDRYTNRASKESYLRLEENYGILRNATDQDGKAFRIIRVPMPPTIYQKPDDTGKIPIRSYLNYAVTNGAVLEQSYWKPGLSATLRDTENGVMDILRGVYPGRAVIGIDSENINLWGGGIHCVTQHMPVE